MTCLSDYGVTIMSQCGYTACENGKHDWQKTQKQDPKENIVCPQQILEQLQAEYTNWSVIKPSLAYQPQS